MSVAATNPYADLGLALKTPATKNDAGIYKDKADEFRFRLKSANGQTLLASEGYQAKASAQNGIRSVQENSADPARFASKYPGVTINGVYSGGLIDADHARALAIGLDGVPRMYVGERIVPTWIAMPEVRTRLRDAVLAAAG